MTINLSVSEARADLYKLVDGVNSSHHPVHIKGKRSSAILIGEEDWRAIQETIYLNSIPGMHKSIKQGMDTSLDECIEEVNW